MFVTVFTLSLFSDLSTVTVSLICGLGFRMCAIMSWAMILGLQNVPATDELMGIDGVESVEPLDESRLRIKHAEGLSPAQALAEAAVRNHWGLLELTPETQTLEQIFVDITSAEHTQSATGEEAA